MGRIIIYGNKSGEGGADTSIVTAGASDVLTGKIIVNADGEPVTGTMPNNGAISSSMDGINIKNITIPEGYTSGGTVSLDNTIDNEVSNQYDIIAQIKNILEHKSCTGVVISDTSSAYVDGERLVL